MSQKMLIDASHNEETRVVVLESKKVEDFDFESLKKLQLSGNIYLAKVTRVEPSLQAAFLDYGGNRHGFLAFSEIHPDYYQIPVEERLALENSDSADDPSTSKSRKVTRKKKSTTKAVSTDFSGEGSISSDPVTSAESQTNNNDNAIIPDELKEVNSVQINQQTEYNSPSEELTKDETFVKKQYRKFRIQEVIKVRQILLIQIVKEERGNKGAALTTYLSLAGRYCVLMPNTPRGGGISRKITNLADRKKLKEIANSLLVPSGSGLIIRTAGSNRTKLEIKRDYEYLIRQWEQVRDLTLSSIAPTTIYEEGSLIKRAIRDLYSRNIDEILVEGDRGYREAKDYMKMLMPSHAKNVKKYEHTVPLFSKFQVEDHLAAMFNPVAQLRSGGYIVIDVTEALVAVDVNSGRATKESSIEDTALKTNLEAAEELARQIKLRDLAGLIVIDFIDMEDRKNNISVEKRIKDRLKNDRARTQVGRISTFGLLEMSRQRLRPGMIETSTQPCAHCHGTGITRSDDSLSLAILREIEEEGIKNIYASLTLKTPTNIANYMLNEKRDHIANIEKRYELTIRIEGESSLISPEYKIEKVKGSDKLSNSSHSIKVDSQILKEDETNEKIQTNEESNSPIEDDVTPDENRGNRRRRRRRRPKPKSVDSITSIDAESIGISADNMATDGQNTQLNVSTTNSANAEESLPRKPSNVPSPSKNAITKSKMPLKEKLDSVPEKTIKKPSQTRKSQPIAKTPTKPKENIDASVVKSDLTNLSKVTRPSEKINTIVSVDGDGSKPTNDPQPKKRGWWNKAKKD